MDQSWQNAVLRELDLIHAAIERHSLKIDTLSESVTTLKIKSGFISALVSALTAFATTIFR